MKENTLLKIALICSLVGLVALYFISEKIEVKDYKPIQSTSIGEDVKLQGIITRITEREDVVFIDVNAQNPINVVLFGDKNLTIKKGDNVEVIGKIQEYKGKNEIIASQIRVIR